MRAHHYKIRFMHRPIICIGHHFTKSRQPTVPSWLTLKKIISFTLTCKILCARKSSAQHRTSGEHQAHSLRHGQMQVYNQLGGQQNGVPILTPHVEKQEGQSTEIKVQL